MIKEGAGMQDLATDIKEQTIEKLATNKYQYAKARADYNKFGEYQPKSQKDAEFKNQKLSEARRKMEIYTSRMEQEKEALQTQINEVEEKINIAQRELEQKRAEKTKKSASERADELEQIINQQVELEMEKQKFLEVRSEIDKIDEIEEPKIESTEYHEAWLEASEYAINDTIETLQLLRGFPENTDTKFQDSALEVVNSLLSEYEMFEMRKYRGHKEVMQNYINTKNALEKVKESLEIQREYTKNVKAQRVRLKRGRGEFSEDPVQVILPPQKLTKASMKAKQISISSNLPEGGTFLTDSWMDLSHYAIFFPEKARRNDFEKDINYLMSKGNDKNLMLDLFDSYIETKNRLSKSRTSALFPNGIKYPFMRKLVSEWNTSVDLLKQRKNPLSRFSVVDKTPIQPFLEEPKFSDEVVKHIGQELGIKESTMSKEEYERIFDAVYKTRGRMTKTSLLKEAPNINFGAAVNSFVKHQILGSYIDMSSRVHGTPPMYYLSTGNANLMIRNSENQVPLFPDISAKMSTIKNTYMNIPFSKDLFETQRDVYINNAAALMYSTITANKVKVPDKYINIVNSLKCSSTFNSERGISSNIFKFIDPDPVENTANRSDRPMNAAVMPSDKMYERLSQIVTRIEKDLGGGTKVASFTMSIMGDDETDFDKIVGYTRDKSLGAKRREDIIIDPNAGPLRQQTVAIRNMQAYGKLFEDLKTITRLSITQKVKEVLNEAKKNDKIGKHLEKLLDMTKDYEKLLEMYIDIGSKTCSMFKPTDIAGKGPNKAVNYPSVLNSFLPFKNAYKIKKSELGRAIVYSTAAMYTSTLGIYVTIMDKISGKIFDIYSRAASKKYLETGKEPYASKTKKGLGSKNVSRKGIKKYLKSEESEESSSSSSNRRDDSTSGDSPPKAKYPEPAEPSSPQPVGMGQDTSRAEINYSDRVTPDISTIIGEEPIPANIDNSISYQETDEVENIVEKKNETPEELDEIPEKFNAEGIDEIPENIPGTFSEEGSLQWIQGNIDEDANLDPQQEIGEFEDSTLSELSVPKGDSTVDDFDQPTANSDSTLDAFDQPTVSKESTAEEFNQPTEDEEEEEPPRKKRVEFSSNEILFELEPEFSSNEILGRLEPEEQDSIQEMLSGAEDDSVDLAFIGGKDALLEAIERNNGDKVLALSDLYATTFGASDTEEEETPPKPGKKRKWKIKDAQDIHFRRLKKLAIERKKRREAKESGEGGKKKKKKKK